MTGAITYISSNRESPEFERKTIEDLMSKRGELPIYAVVQKNDAILRHQNVKGVLVGDVGASGFNFCRQLQLALYMADADYVISCESDCLYSPDYFTFVPPCLNKVYRNENIAIVPYESNYFYKKSSSTFSQVSDRKFLLDRLNLLLKDQPQWSVEMKNFPKEIGLPFLEGWDTFKTEYACVSFKTGRGMRKQTKHEKEALGELPYWGTAKQIREKYL